MQTDNDTDTTQRPSAKTFRDPLLKALGSLSQYKAGVSLPHRDVYGPVLALIDMTEDQYGMANGTSSPQTHRWIQLAFMSLKEEGLGDALKKGRWGLTEQGVQVARTLSDVVATPEAPKPDPVVSGLITESVVAVYNPDPYLRSLALAATKCIGHFSTRSETCMSCPVGGQCQNKMTADMSALAEELRKEDETTKGAPPRGPTPAAQPTDAGDTPKWNNDNIDMITNHTETVCFRCNEPIPQGERCYWQHNEDGQSGLFHTECK